LLRAAASRPRGATISNEEVSICALRESPATASLHSATPKRKNVSCFSVFRGGGFFLKWKGHFSFLGFCLPSIQAVWRGFNSDSILRKLFSGDMDFRKTETNLFLNFVRAEEGSGEESARAFRIFLASGHGEKTPINKDFMLK
jgi:hypothetical protein